MNAVNYIKENLTKDLIQELLSKYCSHISDTGDGFRTNCPIHHGDNPTSFVWNYDNGLWFCHSGSCGGGDIFDFIANIYNLDIETQFKTIVIKTAEELNIDIQGLKMGERASRAIKETRRWIDYMLSKKPKKNLPYDIKKIGKLKPLNSYRNFTKNTIDYFHGSYSELYNRIVVPLYDEQNNTVGVSLRRINSKEQAKWLHIPKHLNTRLIIYNQANIDGNKITLVEGAFDVWNLYQIGVKNMGATLGAHITKEQEDIILQNYTDVELMFDKDRAGILATIKAIKQLKDKVNLTIRDLGEYNDPGEIPSKEAFNELEILKPYSYIEKYKNF